jgi:zinc protease
LLPGRRLHAIVILALALFAVIAPAQAIAIKEVKTPSGIVAWLVEDHTNPLIAMRFSFHGGSANDPPGKEGTANFLTGMLDEGAGDLDSTAFQAKREELAMKMSFDAESDYFDGSFQTLSERREPSFALLKLALTSPRFDPLALERVRSQFLVGAAENAEDPERIASRAWMVAALGSHPYARDGDGTVETIKAITAGDLRDLQKSLFTRKNMKVAVVGDIDEKTLMRLLDETFGALPDTDPPAWPPMAKIAAKPSTAIIDRDIPQSIITFGHEGILRDDPAFIPAYVASFILGGGGFGSRLTDEIRERRGLTYGVSIGLYPLERAGLVVGSLSTRNEKAGEALQLVKEVMKKFADEGPTAAELADAKTYLTGSYALRFDSNTKLAGQLLGIQQTNLGIDYVNRRNSLIEAVTLDEVKAQAKRITLPGQLTTIVVGRPTGIKPSGNQG